MRPKKQNRQPHLLDEVARVLTLDFQEVDGFCRLKAGSVTTHLSNNDPPPSSLDYGFSRYPIKP